MRRKKEKTSFIIKISLPALLVKYYDKIKIESNLVFKKVKKVTVDSIFMVVYIGIKKGCNFVSYVTVRLLLMRILQGPEM